MHGIDTVYTNLQRSVSNTFQPITQYYPLAFLSAVRSRYLYSATPKYKMEPKWFVSKDACNLTTNIYEHAFTSLKDILQQLQFEYLVNYINVYQNSLPTSLFKKYYLPISAILLVNSNFERFTYQIATFTHSVPPTYGIGPSSTDESVSFHTFLLYFLQSTTPHTQILPMFVNTHLPPDIFQESDINTRYTAVYPLIREDLLHCFINIICPYLRLPYSIDISSQYLIVYNGSPALYDELFDRLGTLFDSYFSNLTGQLRTFFTAILSTVYLSSCLANSVAHHLPIPDVEQLYVANTLEHISTKWKEAVWSTFPAARDGFVMVNLLPDLCELLTTNLSSFTDFTSLVAYYRVNTIYLTDAILHALQNATLLHNYQCGVFTLFYNHLQSILDKLPAQFYDEVSNIFQDLRLNLPTSVELHHVVSYAIKRAFLFSSPLLSQAINDIAPYIQAIDADLRNYDYSTIVNSTIINATIQQSTVTSQLQYFLLDVFNFLIRCGAVHALFNLAASAFVLEA